MCKGTKNVPISQNEIHKRPMRAKSMTHYGIELPASYGLFVAIYGHQHV